MAAARGGSMVVRTGKRSSRRGIRGRSQARRESGSEDTSDEEYRLGADGEEEDEVSSEDGEDEVGELEVSDEGDEPEDEMSSEGSELEDEDEDFVINSGKRRKRKPVPKKKVKKNTKPKARKRPPAKKRRSGAVPRVCCDEDEEGMVGEPKTQRRVRKRRRFGDVDEEEDGDDVDFSPEDEEEDDDFDEDELEDEEDDVEDDDDDLEDESNDEDDEVFGKVSVKRKNASRKGAAKNKRGGKKRKPNTAVRKRKRSNTKGGGPKRRRKAFVSSDDDEDDEDFVLDDELIDEEEDEDEEEDVETAEITRKPNRSGGANARRRRLALEYDSPASYSSDFDDTALDRDTGSIIGLCTKPRTAWGFRSKQELKGKEKAAEEDDPPEKRICGVCLSEERDAHILGLLNSCAHFFCFTCILEWSKVESRCPVCKQRFSTITKSSGSDLAIQLRPIVVNVPKRDQVYQPSEEEVRGYLDPYANVVCIECLQGGEDTLMLLCDICNSAAHTYCVGLGREVPEGDWYCDACRSAEYAQPNVPSEENENQQVPNVPEPLQPPPPPPPPCQHTSNRTGRVDIDMNLPYIPSPERRPPENFADESSYLRTGDLPQSAQVLLPTQEDPAARASRSARQSASTVSERRALRLRIQNMFTNNWTNVTQFRHNPPQGEGRQNPPVLFDDLNASNRDFF